jgi:2-phospho-L-lactate guanylyltransferase
MKAPAHTAVVVPIKSFELAKGRLAEVLDAPARAALAKRCAEAVLRAAAPLPVYVVCDDEQVADWAYASGATIVRAPRPGLNQAAAAGREAARDAGCQRVLIVHSDLPKPESLATLANEPADVVIVPDRHGDGTNALLLPAQGEFSFRYGIGSFAAHRAEAAARGWAVKVVERPDLALDLDTPDDLAAAGLS